MNSPATEPSRRNWLSFSSLCGLIGLNAFNDNFARFLLLPLSAWLVGQGDGVNIEHILGVLMVLPFILFAPTSGWLADRFSKNQVTRWAALMQLVVLGLMVVSIWLRSMPLAMIAFFLLATQSALLSPAKSGILKELLGEKKLALGSGISEGVTILSVLLGQISAGLFFDARLRGAGDGWSASFLPMVILFVFCLLPVVLARLIEKTPAHSTGSLTPEVAFRHVRDFKLVWAQRRLRLSALGIAFFWSFASFILLAVFQVAKQLHGGGEGTGTANSLMMATASIGIAAGSVGAGWASRRGTELGLVPIGGLVMALGSILLTFSPVGGVVFCVGLFVSGAGAAIFLVPLKAHLIDLSPSDERGRILSVSNLFNNIGMAVAVGMQFLLIKIGLSIGAQMGIFSILAIGTTYYVMHLVPRSFWQLVGLSLIRFLYRIRVRDGDNMPSEGGVILCPNHMSFVDAMVMSAASPRPVRFLIAEQCYRRKWVGKFAKTFDAVPVSSERAKEAIRLAAEEAAAGNVVCIFAEGQLSRTGARCEIKRGFEMIARKSKCPVVPAYMHGLWGTFTSFDGGRYFRKWPRRLGSGLTVSFGPPLAPREATAAALGASWQEMAGASYDLEAETERDLSDLGNSLTAEPEMWWEDARSLREMERESLRPLMRQARELYATSFWQRGDRVLLEWTSGDVISQVLGLLLPSLVGVKVTLVDAGTSEKELLRIAREEKLNRMVLRRMQVSESFLEQVRKEEILVQLLASWQGEEDVLSKEGVYPSLIRGEQIVTWSQPHPDETNSPLWTHQPGWMKGSVGRMLPGLATPEGWQEGPERFLSLKG